MPSITSWGNSHNTNMGIVELGWWVWAILSRFDSTIADAIILRMFRIWPTPSRWRGVSDWWVSFSHNEQRKRSIRVRDMTVDIVGMTTIDPAGILKFGPRWRSIVRAWRIVKLPRIATGILKNMPVDHMGKILIRALRSSTCCKVHKLHGFAIEPTDWMSPSVFSAARLKSL